MTRHPILTALALVFCTAGFTACPGPEPLPPPTPEPTWQRVDPVTFKPIVGEWTIIECPQNGFEKGGSGTTVVMGQGGYTARCAFGSPTIDLSGFAIGTELRVTLKQRSGPFKEPQLPVWSHLWLRINANSPMQASLDNQQIRPMFLSNNAVSEASANFTMTADMRTLDLAVGFDPSVVVLTKPEDQPVTEFQEVHLEALLPTPTN